MGAFPNAHWQLPTFNLFEFHKRQTTYCLCIPIINEGDNFKKQLKNLQKYKDVIDIIIADGGSTDGSTNHSYLKTHHVRSLLVKTSEGKQGTQLRMGFAYALTQGYKGIITVDGNNKDAMSAIPEFIKALDQGYDCVAGSRFIKGGQGINTPLSRYIGIRFICTPLLSLSSRRVITDSTNGFKGYSRKYLLDKNVLPIRNKFISYELVLYLSIRAAQLGLRTKEIPVSRKYPKKGIPTKIKGLRGNIAMLLTVIKVALGYYNPN